MSELIIDRARNSTLYALTKFPSGSVNLVPNGMLKVHSRVKIISKDKGSLIKNIFEY